MFVVAAYIRARVRCRYQKGRCREGSLERMLRAYVVVALLPLSGPVIGAVMVSPTSCEEQVAEACRRIRPVPNIPFVAVVVAERLSSRRG